MAIPIAIAIAVAATTCTARSLLAQPFNAAVAWVV